MSGRLHQETIKGINLANLVGRRVWDLDTRVQGDFALGSSLWASEKTCTTRRAFI